MKPNKANGSPRRDAVDRHVAYPPGEEETSDPDTDRGGWYVPELVVEDGLDYELLDEQISESMVLKRRIGGWMSDIKKVMTQLKDVDGFIGCCLVDSDSGMALGHYGGTSSFNVEAAGTANAEVVKSKRKAMRMLGLKDEIEDILISLGGQYHIIRPLARRPGLFLYLAVERSKANLGLVRLRMAEAEAGVVSI